MQRKDNKGQDMKLDEFVKECMKRKYDKTFYEWKKQVLINSHQPERLSEKTSKEEAIV